MRNAVALYSGMRKEYLLLIGALIWLIVFLKADTSEVYTSGIVLFKYFALFITIVCAIFFGYYVGLRQHKTQRKAKDR